MQRARHMSLDYLGSSNRSANSHANARGSEDWSQFLSTSMAALATDDDPDELRVDAGSSAAVSAPAARALPSGLGDEGEDAFAQHQQDVIDAAVAVATSPRARASPSAMKIDTFGLEPHVTLLSAQSDEYMMLGLGGKSRSDSISEALTSSTESSPSASAWRPLGRRMTPQGSAGANSGSSNQLDHLFEIPPFTSSSSSGSGALDAQSAVPSSKKLRHTSSFRDIVHLSSSGSSQYESSSSSDEEPQEPPARSIGAGKDELKQSTFRMMMRKGSAPVLSMRPSIIDVDPSFAESSLTVLTSLPAHPRSLSIDNTFVSSSHVKSPVLGNRKDSQTWQLQDEEFLKTSPRFGALSASAGPDMSVFGSAGLLSEELNNQIGESEPRPRFTKDMRASSVDFTYSSRASEVNPPLPPPPEPLQRLRAKSFSYSSGYGASGYANAPGYNNNGSASGGKQYMAHPHQPTLHDYHVNMRGFHHPGASPPPVTSPPPQSGGIRPPRVSIPTDSPMHQYSHHHHHQQHQHQHHQYGPPQYRRYSSDTFAVPPYPEMYNPEQENQARHSNGGRGMRSYSMETSNFAATRPFRSQSMEGPQPFVAGAQLEYPTMTRTSSAGMGYEGWPRGPMDMGGPAPPLPPDSRSNNAGSSSSNSMGHHYPSPPPEAYYEVEFKRGRHEIFAGNATYSPGDYVKVEADRGEDIGRIVQRSTDLAKLQSSSGENNPASPGDDAVGRSKRHDAPVKKIIAVANQRERDMLSEQRKEEHEVFEVCKSKVRQRLLPMNVIDAEYQFDRHKLTFFFEADRRIDFRELVRDLFAIYKTRIWLQQVVPGGGKKVMIDYDAN